MAAHAFTTTRTPQLSALRLAQSPRVARRLAWALVAVFLVSPAALVVLPWQQSLSATGRVIAYDPTRRQQVIEAPVDGRVSRWHVKEGQRVRAGDPLVSIQDPDPELPRRLGAQRQAVVDRQAAARDRIRSFDAQRAALALSQTQAVQAARNRAVMGEKSLQAADEAVKDSSYKHNLEKSNYAMEAELLRDGLTSKLAYLTAQQKRDSAAASLARARKSREGALAQVEALKADLAKVRTDADAAVSAALASKQSAEGDLASAARELAELDTRIARQSTQDVTTPYAGTVFRILANAGAGGATVKAGEPLLALVPDIDDPDERMVELFVDGNDAPQLTALWRRRLEGDPDAQIRVRLQFEGWPAIQSVGWPSVAVGTFGGLVVFVDAHDDGKGKFRVLVKPDPDDKPWPEDFSLRQGVRANGWLVLDRVSLGYELWRRFNGFPPVLAGADEAGKEGGKKPGKVKVPK